MQCSATDLWMATHCSAMDGNAVQWNGWQRSAVQWMATQCSAMDGNAVQCSETQCSVVMYSAVC